MNLFDILRLKVPALSLHECKIHLAGWNGIESPLDVFLQGNFKEWQEWQTKRNFERPLIVSLIQLQHQHQWLFSGCFRQNGSEFFSDKNLHRYKTSALAEAEDLTGRLVVRYARDGRNSYRKAERCADEMTVHSLRPERLTTEAFPGYRRVIVSKRQLDLIVAQQIESWKTALSSVAGVYLITDTRTGRHYVGSACGVGGIWQRWCEYSGRPRQQPAPRRSAAVERPGLLPPLPVLHPRDRRHQRQQGRRARARDTLEKRALQPALARRIQCELVPPHF